MTTRLLVASRKGLFQFAPANGTWEITQRSFLGQPVSAAVKSPRTGKLFAALNLGHFGVKFHVSDDDGQSWQEIDPPSYAGVDADKEEKDKPSLQLIWVMEFDADGNLWAGTIPGGLFKSRDDGQTWSLNEPLWNDPLREQWFGGGYDAPGIHSICFDPRDKNKIAVGVSCGGIWLSDDGGNSWRVSTKGMRAEYMPPDQAENPATQDPHRLVQCPGSPDTFWVQHHNGIFLSKDRCATWQELKSQPSSFGFAVAVHPHNPQRAWFAPAQKDEFRIPVDGKFVINRTDDYGQSFTTIEAGLPTVESYDLVYRHGMDVDSTGDIIAAASTTGNMWISENGGDNWQTAACQLPPVYAIRFV